MAADFQAIAEAANAHITATAVKRGRRPEWPYVPVLVYGPTEGTPAGYTAQIKGKAFADRDEAVAFAQGHIDRMTSTLAARLALPAHRALREQYGLPRELAEALA